MRQRRYVPTTEGLETKLSLSDITLAMEGPKLDDPTLSPTAPAPPPPLISPTLAVTQGADATSQAVMVDIQFEQLLLKTQPD